ncbi:MAG: D-alanyl-D-alanine carboxypeptidase family protein [Spirochaetia bacterium]
MHRWLSRLNISLALAALLCAAPLSAVPVLKMTEPAKAPFVLYARSAILIDQVTGRILYERNADQPFVPASLAKLMTLHIIYEKLDDRSISRSDVVHLTSNAWAAHQAPGSSLMNLGPGQIVTVEELMKGVAIASGNDAATALAEYVAGSTRGFIRLMNDEARFLGYTITHFTDPAGVREDNLVTAREFADFCRRYIALHPEALKELHSLREFDYPLAQNIPDGRLVPRETKKQYNANYLVWDGWGVDGLKTGHLDDDNFTAAITARRGDSRLIAVLLGVSGRSLEEGARNRLDDGMALLSYGFRTYTTIELEPPRLPAVHVWKGESQELPIVPSAPVNLTVRPTEMDKLSYSVMLSTPLVAPLMRGQRVGELVYTAGSEVIGRIPLVAASAVQRAGLLRRMWDTAVLGFSSAVGGTLSALHASFSGLPLAEMTPARSEPPADARTP